MFSQKSPATVRSNSRSRSKATSQPPPSEAPGWLAVLGLAQPTLRVHINEPVLFLRPEAPDVPSADPVLHGTVTLVLPKPRILSHLSVRLVGRFNVATGEPGRPFESGETLNKTLSLVRDVDSETGLSLEAGEHRWEFDLIVPSNGAVYERCSRGSVRHAASATAGGLGMLGGNLESEEVPVFMVVNPAGSDTLDAPPPFEYILNGTSEDFGPYMLSLRSQHTLIAGLLLLRLSLPSAPAPLAIFSIHIKVTQHFALTSPSAPDNIIYPPPETRTICTMDSRLPPNMSAVGEGTSSGGPKRGPAFALGALKVIQAGESWDISNFSRLGEHTSLRPTTREWTKTPIRINHRISVEILYRPLLPTELRKKPGELSHQLDELKRFTASEPFNLFSCFAFVDSTRVPAYTPEKEVHEDMPECMCSYPFHLLVKYHAGTWEESTLPQQAPAVFPAKSEAPMTPGLRVP